MSESPTLKECQHCGVKYGRKRFKSKMESNFCFKKRKFCSPKCASVANRARLAEEGAKSRRVDLGDHIPAAPFVAWLRVQLEGALQKRLAERLGIPERTLYRYKNSQGGGHKVKRNGKWVSTQPTHTDHFYRNPVEDMLNNAGVSIYDLYPELQAEDDPPLEPDEFCRRCGEWTTPIRGVCPWCEDEVVPWPLEDLEDAA